MEEASDKLAKMEELYNGVESLSWYHSIDLGNGVVTPGAYDHRPYLGCYGLPKDLKGKTALDIGAASGFFSFELEDRGADVTATELPTWMAHDFGPLYQPDMNFEEAESYLHDPFLFAHKVRGSHVQREFTNVYDITPQTMGLFDLVFCGSVLLHLTDPVRALWHIQSVTKKVAIIATVIHPLKSAEPLAAFVGQNHGDVWWIPNRAALEAMVQSAGFKGWEWFSEFRLDYRDGQLGPYHAVIRAWNTEERPKLLDFTDRPPEELIGRVVIEDPEIQELKNQVRAYEKMKSVRFVRWLHAFKQTLEAGLKRG